MLEHKMYMVFGDWSNDGHGKSKKILIETNIPVVDMQNAYKDSCKKLGISFNHNDDFTGIERDWKEKLKYHICTEYEEYTLSNEVISILKENNCPLVTQLVENDNMVESIEVLLELLMWFIQQSLPNLKWKQVEDNIPVFNGYWDGNLNVQIGYGMFND